MHRRTLAEQEAKRTFQDRLLEVGRDRAGRGATRKEILVYLADEAGVSEYAVKNWLADERSGVRHSSPSVGPLVTLAESTGVSLDWLFRGKGPKYVTERLPVEWKEHYRDAIVAALVAGGAAEADAEAAVKEPEQLWETLVGLARQDVADLQAFAKFAKATRVDSLTARHKARAFVRERRTLGAAATLFDLSSFQGAGGDGE